MQSFITTIGLAKISAANFNNPLTIGTVEVGDGNGGYPVLAADTNSLARKVISAPAEYPRLMSGDDTVKIFDIVVPPYGSGFTVREIAIRDTSGDIIAVSQIDPVLIPPEGSSLVEAVISLCLKNANSANITVAYDTSSFISTFEYFKRRASDIGKTLVSGSFEQSAELTSPDEVVLRYTTKQILGWGGGFPKPVPLGSSPASTGGFSPATWLDFTDVTFATVLGANTGAAHVMSSLGTSVEDRLLAIESRSVDLETIKPELVTAAETVAIATVSGFSNEVSLTNGSAALELGRYPIENIETTKKVGTNFEILESVTGANDKGASRTFYGDCQFEPYHPCEFPVDFTPDAPALLVGTSYTTNPDYTERVYQGCVSAAKTGDRMWAGFRGDIQLYTEGSDTDVAEHTGNFVTLCKSDDDGVTWSEYGYIRYADGNTYCCHEPVLWQAPNGKLWVFVTVSGNGTDQDGTYGTYLYVCKNPESSASSLQWETPVKIFKYGFCNFPPVDIDGKWLMATYLLNSTAAIYKDRIGKHVFNIDVVGKKAYSFSKLPDSIDIDSFSEISIAQDIHGKVRAIWRTANSSQSLETSTSQDGGKTWSATSKYTPAVGDNASTRACLKTSPTGRTVLVYNNEAVSRRYLTVALSDNGGVSYPYKMTVEQPQPMSSSYPDVIFGDNGELYVFYDKARATPGYRKILCTKMLESEIMAGTFNARTTYVSDKGYV